MIVRKAYNNEWYIGTAKRVPNTTGKYTLDRTDFIIKHQSGRLTGVLSIQEINFPKELIGKRIRMKVEVLK